MKDVSRAAKSMEMREGRFTTWGPERGCCGHVHDTIEKAWVCVETDRIEMQALDLGGTDRQLRQLQTEAAMDKWDPNQGPGLPVPYVAWEHLVDPEAFLARRVGAMPIWEVRDTLRRSFEAAEALADSFMAGDTAAENAARRADRRREAADTAYGRAERVMARFEAEHGIEIDVADILEARTIRTRQRQSATDRGGPER